MGRRVFDERIIAMFRNRSLSLEPIVYSLGGITENMLSEFQKRLQLPRRTRFSDVVKQYGSTGEYYTIHSLALGTLNQVRLEVNSRSWFIDVWNKKTALFSVVFFAILHDLDQIF